MAPFTSLFTAVAALLLATSVTADIVSPSNASFTKQGDSTQPVLEIQSQNAVAPVLLDLSSSNASDLTSNGGATAAGNLFTILAPTFPQPQNSAVVLISCDSGDYPGEITLDQVYSATANNTHVVAIVFYSQHSGSCRLNNATAGFPHLFSMTSATDAQALIDDLNKVKYQDVVARVATQQVFNQDGGGSQTASTTVAMIILYSITGLITGLFVLIIISGAIRAHRHPERYGPRNIVGRTRQSRAKGMARAMLDTIPIVKFGEQEAAANKAGDLELGSPTRQTPEPPSSTGEHHEGETPSDQTESDKDRPTVTDGPGAAMAGGSKESSGDNAEEGLGCSICTEDFEKGQDIRVLPCNHKFHPACVDPWLLDVSGTCPLCRVDLRPAGAQDEGQETSEDGARTNGENSVNNSLPPPLDPNAASSPSSRRRLNAFRSMFHWRRMEELTQEERIEALRQFREQEEARRLTRAERSSAGTGASNSQGNEADQDDRTRWTRLRGRITRLR